MAVNELAIERSWRLDAGSTTGLKTAIFPSDEERAMLRFRQMKALQKFASIHANVHNHVSLERHLIDRQTYKETRSVALTEWRFLID